MLSPDGWITIVVFVAVLALLVRETFSPDLTMLGGACALLITGVVSPTQFLSGFARPIVFTLAMLFVVVRSLEINGVLGFLAQRALPKRDGYARQLAKMLLPVGAASAFLNNTPIVLMLTSVVRGWAMEKALTPSKFLIPISFAAILGGMCTLIGTAPNLIVDGLLDATDPAAGFSFFELGKVGLPCFICGYLYLVFIGRHLVPERRDPAIDAASEVRKTTSEFQVVDDCPLIGKSIRESARRYFGPEALIEVRRGDRTIASPPPDMVIREGDQLVFLANISEIANLHAMRGLQSVADPTFTLDIASPHVAEVVVAIGSRLAGQTLRTSAFRTRYGASAIGVYRQGRRLPGPVGDIVLHPGDTLILLASQPWSLDRRFTGDLYPIRHGEELTPFRPWRALWSVLVLIAMVVAVTLGVPILYGSLGAALLLLASRSLTIGQARRGISWSLLLLVASAFALGSALFSTGVADLFARGILNLVGSNPHLLIGTIFLITLLLTEVVTNAAAALMLFPIATEVVLLAGYDSLMALKAAGVTVAIGASSSFLTPIGYQTNTMVYGPGGYRFSDYARVGALLVLIQLVLVVLLVPYFWPLQS
jgi:di/tricarboxylate transporter